MQAMYAYEGIPSFLGEVAPRLEEAGFRLVEDTASADIILTYFATQNAVEDAYFGTDGLATQVKPGGILIDCSPITPNLAREIQAMVTINDMTMVEAPLVLKSLVEEDAFAPANLMIPVSCEGEVPAAAQNMLTVLANTVEYGLASGLPQMLRIHNIMVLVSELVSTVETGALQMRAQGGAQLSAALVAQFSPQASEEVMTAVSEQRFTSPYTVEVLLGELASALSAAEDGEVIVPHLEAALHVYELLAILGGSDLAPAALCLVYQDEEAGVRAGLDWSRAAQVYGNEHDVADEVWEDEDTEGNDDDDLYAQFAADLGYGEQAAEDDYNEWVDLDDDEAR